MQQNSHTDVIFLVILLFASNSLLHVACEGLGSALLVRSSLIFSVCA